MTEVFCIFFFHFHCMQCMVPDLSAFKQNEVTILLKSSVVVFTFTRILTEFSCKLLTIETKLLTQNFISIMYLKGLSNS